jgi:hypothetical protein
MLSGVMLLWFVLTAAAIVFVAIDIRATPESPVLKWGFVLLTAYTGPIGAFLYVLGCREPLPGLHERYVAVRWRQVLGSTMHCVAGDGVGILAGAALASFLTLPHLAGVAVEYLLGFGFGWTVFQALFMRDMAGGSYPRALLDTFIPEFLSMNFLMAGMVPVAALGRTLAGGHLDPIAPAFWFVMSMALLAGFVLAYPVNGWLVARGLKHGMMTVRRPAPAGAPAREPHASPGGWGGAGERAPGMATPHVRRTGHESRPSIANVAGMSVLSMAVLALAIAAALAIQAGGS